MKTTVALADPVSGIGTIAPITQFADILNDDGERADYRWRDGYAAKLVDPFLTMLGIQTTPERFAAARDAAGIREDEVLIYVAKVPETDGWADEGVHQDEFADTTDELWLVAFNHGGNGEAIDLRSANLVRAI